MRYLRLMLFALIMAFTFVSAQAQVSIRIGGGPYYWHGHHYHHRSAYWRHHHRYYRYY